MVHFKARSFLGRAFFMTLYFAVLYFVLNCCALKELNLFDFTIFLLAYAEYPIFLFIHVLLFLFHRGSRVAAHR